MFCNVIFFQRWAWKIEYPISIPQNSVNQYATKKKKRFYLSIHFYNCLFDRRSHAKRMLAGGSSKPRKKVSSTTTNTNTNTNLAMSNVGANSVSGSFVQPNVFSGNGYRIPRVHLANVDRSNGEHLSTNSDSTIVTIHDMPSVDNT